MTTLGFAEGVAPVSVGPLWGYINLQGKWCIEPRFLSASRFENGLAFVQLHPSEIASMQTKKQTICDPMSTTNDVVWAIVDTAWRYRLLIKGDLVEHFDGKAVVLRVGKKVGCIGLSGDLIVPMEYENIERLSEGLARVTKEGKTGYIDCSGRAVIKCIFSDGREFESGVTVACSKGLWGIIGKDGEWVMPPKYSWMGAFKEGYAPFRKDGKVGLIDRSGIVKIQPTYSDMGNVSEGLVAIGVENKDGMVWYGYLKCDGSVWHEPSLYFGTEFSGGIAVVGVAQSEEVRKEQGSPPLSELESRGDK